MVLTDTGRLGASPCSGGCTGSVLTLSEDITFITTVVDGRAKSYPVWFSGALQDTATNIT